MVALHVMPCQVMSKKQVGYAMIVLPCLALNRMIIVVSHESPLEGTNITKAGTVLKILFTQVLQSLKAL